MYIPNKHLNVSCVARTLWKTLTIYSFSLKKEKGTVIFIYLRGISWNSENLGQLACGGHIDRPKAGIGSSSSSTTVFLLWDDHIGVWKLTGKGNIS